MPNVVKGFRPFAEQKIISVHGDQDFQKYHYLNTSQVGNTKGWHL